MGRENGNRRRRPSGRVGDEGGRRWECAPEEYRLEEERPERGRGGCRGRGAAPRALPGGGWNPPGQGAAGGWRCGSVRWKR